MGATSSHPNDQVLQSYGLGKLDDASARSVDDHLESCSDCQSRVAEMSSENFLSRLRDASVKPGAPVTGPVVSSLAGLSMVDAGASTTSPPAAETLPPGLAEHPDYEVIRELGHGGMGTVYLAKNRLMGRYEVLKVVSSHLIKRRGVLDRFLGEIRNAARLHHTNIVTAYSASRLGEGIVFAMEYVEGLDLAKLVKAKGSLPVANACNYVHQAALGLQHANELGMVHRDIKPSNLMLARQGNRAVLKVLDFGLAKVKSEGAIDGGLTHEGQMLGTPDYIAPEQIRNARDADIRADIYSLGCTLYYLLTGGPPFKATSLYEILQAHHSIDARPLNLARPEVPVELAALVARMMAKGPERRFQEPKDVAKALKPFFKSVYAGTGISKPDVSRADCLGSKGQRESTDLEPIPSGLLAATGATSAARAPARTSRPGASWESLVNTHETDSLAEVAKMGISRPDRRRSPLLWPSVSVGVLLLGFVVMWAVFFRVNTSNGMIEMPATKPPNEHVRVNGSESTRDANEDARTAPLDHNHSAKVARLATEGFKEGAAKLALVTDTLSAGLRPGPVVYVDEFNDPASGWPNEPAAQRLLAADEHHGYVDGLYRLEAKVNRWWIWKCPYVPPSEFTCELVGRVHGDKPSSRGLMGIHLICGPRYFQVKIFNTGQLQLSTKEDDSPKPTQLGWISHPAIKTGSRDFNTLVLQKSKRRADILVNGVRVCDPVALPWDSPPTFLGLEISCHSPSICAEYERIEIRELRAQPTTP